MRWVESIQYVVEQGVDTTVEIGPGRVLSGLNKRIHKGLNLLATDDLSRLAGRISLRSTINRRTAVTLSFT